MLIGIEIDEREISKWPEVVKLMYKIGATNSIWLGVPDTKFRPHQIPKTTFFVNPGLLPKEFLDFLAPLLSEILPNKGWTMVAMDSNTYSTHQCEYKEKETKIGLYDDLELTRGN
jgi:hypothetical protein